MAATAGSIDQKVVGFLSSQHATMTFRQCENALVELGILNDEELEADHHRDRIRSLYRAWKAGFEADRNGNHQPLPVQPPTPDSLAPQATSSKISISPPLEEHTRDESGLALKEAIRTPDPTVSHNSPQLLKINNQLLLTLLVR